MLEYGYNVGYSFVKGWWLDTGKKDDILYANVLILDEKAKSNIKGEIENSKIIGRVEIEENSKIINSEIRGPCIIGKDCLIQDSFIGPYTSIGNGTKIINSSIEHSIILENSFIKGIEKLDDSIIGRNSKLMKNKERNVLRLNIGDYSEIEV
jgi:glucose-1-phosphate thymidylyltransferase